MANSKTATPTEQESQLIEKLRSNPQLLDLFNEVTQVYECKRNTLSIWIHFILVRAL